jgi:hypothetical protein
MWKNIEEELPPKDKPFLGFTKCMLHERDFIVVIVWYEGGEDDEGYDQDEGYYAMGEWGKYNREWSCYPTHWMSLPKPP